MRHVFVETNWVVAFAAPAHLRMPAAAHLHGKATSGDVRLYLPAVSITEARNPVRTKFQPRSTADSLRSYLRWATNTGKVDSPRAEVVRVVLDQYEAAVSAELDQLEDRLRSLTRHPGIEVFALTDAMLARAVELATLNLELKPFDQAILAAVLVRAEQLRDAGAEEVAFCELDGDLQPWDRNGDAKQPLTDLYDSAGVWVYGDFSLSAPPRPATFPT
jgi:hypothetical protein